MPTLISFRSKLLLVILDFWPISKKTLKILNCDRRQNSYLDMPRKRENFSQSNIDAAIDAFINDGLSKKAAAQKYGIPRSTLQHRLKNPNMKITCGPATVLTQDEEDLLQTWIIDSCRKGFPRRKEDLLNSVQKFLETNKRQNPFKNNLPGFGWYKAFMRRHPLISVRTSEHVTSASACISETDIKKWFSEVHLYLVENGLNEILEDPTRVFNGDETGFSLCPKNKTVLAPRGVKDIYEVAIGNSKENLTVMFSFNAAGSMCHPMIIYNYQRIPQDILKSVPLQWGIGHSDSGWMKSELFYEYIANIFHPFLIEKGIKLPVILFVDGHKSHLTFQLSELCSNLSIILIALYPNSTRILQPADVAAFRPLKSGWKRGVCEWRNENGLCSAVTKKDFAPILKKVIDKFVKPETLINGFKACGLYPWNPDSIDFKKCLGKKQLKENIDEGSSFQIPNSIGLEQFCDIVGPTYVEKLKNINNVNEQYSDSNEMHVINKIYKLLSGCTDNVLNDNENCTTKACTNNSCKEIDDDNVILVPEEINEDNVILVPEEINESFWDSSDIVEEMILEKKTNQEEMTMSVEETPNLFLNIVSENQNIQDEMEIEGALETPRTINKKVFKISPLQSCLVWPVTPERKGKRSTERIPYVISSESWQNIQQTKEEKKRKIEMEKEDRKKNRIENRLKKSSLTGKTLKKQPTRVEKLKVARNIFPGKIIKKKIPTETITSEALAEQIDNHKNVVLFNVDDDESVNDVITYVTVGLCFSCGKNLSEISKGVDCTFCSHMYHLKCLTKDEFCDLGVGESFLFICKPCQNHLK